MFNVYVMIRVEGKSSMLAIGESGERKGNPLAIAALQAVGRFVEVVCQHHPDESQTIQYGTYSSAVSTICDGFIILNQCDSHVNVRIQDSGYS